MTRRDKRADDTRELYKFLFTSQSHLLQTTPGRARFPTQTRLRKEVLIEQEEIDHVWHNFELLNIPCFLTGRCVELFTTAAMDDNPAWANISKCVSIPCRERRKNLSQHEQNRLRFLFMFFGPIVPAAKLARSIGWIISVCHCVKIGCHRTLLSDPPESENHRFVWKLSLCFYGFIFFTTATACNDAR